MATKSVRNSDERLPMGKTRYTRSSRQKCEKTPAKSRFLTMGCALWVEVFRSDLISLPAEVRGSLEADFRMSSCRRQMERENDGSIEAGDALAQVLDVLPHLR